MNNWNDGQNTLNRGTKSTRTIKTPAVDEPIKEPFIIKLGPPTKEKITKAISKLKNNKSPDIDNIESEMLKTDTKLATEQLYKLFQKVLKRFSQMTSVKG